MAEGFGVRTGALRAAAGASREVGAGLAKPGDDAGAGGAVCATALAGFACADALGAVARSWREQVAYIGEGYTRAGDLLESNAVGYERNEQAVVNLLLPHGS
ncbi:hypothetical protein LO772_19765 [Yinghuangia sp. ASG 101]|uniref:hypothetical protein n=1 Tax=Yinghuangia sp. ASG 101 TaxID=2896848 RepID=UPI001E5F9CA4|nr:hypothetical protein [Yinghuangia sp. ASG 101]UGQ09190.1 hypothetical protein LO772_19765 [Yinghuangia sp. ASG 101]